MTVLQEVLPHPLLTQTHSPGHIRELEFVTLSDCLLTYLTTGWVIVSSVGTLFSTLSFPCLVSMSWIKGVFK